MEVEEEPDEWGPHVIEWRECEAAGVFSSIRYINVYVYGLTVGLGM